MPPLQNPESTPRIKQQETMGPLVGIIVIVVMLGLGALYFWGKRLNQQAPVPYIPGDTPNAAQ